MMAISYPPADIPADFKWTGATSVYGISDLRAWADDMHKFQRMYVSWLIGGSYEEIPQVYVERSPITHVNKIKTPLLVSLILTRSCCGGLGFEVDHEPCSSSMDRTMRSFCRLSQIVCIVC